MPHSRIRTEGRLLRAAAIVQTLLWVSPSLTHPALAPAGTHRPFGGGLAFLTPGTCQLSSDLRNDCCGICHQQRAWRTISPVGGRLQLSSRVDRFLATNHCSARCAAGPTQRARACGIFLCCDVSSPSLSREERKTTPGIRYRPALQLAATRSREDSEDVEDYSMPRSRKAEHGNEYKIALDDAAPRATNEVDDYGDGFMIRTWDGDLMPSGRLLEEYSTSGARFMNASKYGLRIRSLVWDRMNG